MHSTLNPKPTHPHDVFVAHVDEELAHVYEQITRVDNEIARAKEQLSKIKHDAAHHPSDPRTRTNTAVRGITGILLAACICVAAIAWQSTYGDVAKQIIASWAP
jgi:ferric-dicitrate binding protein FerR (iron transport regulator)